MSYSTLTPVVGFVLEIIGAITKAISDQINVVVANSTQLEGLTEGIFGSNASDPGLIYWLQVYLSQ